MNDYINLPEDLEPEAKSSRHDAGSAALSVHLNRSYIHLNASAHKALGLPSYAEVLFGRKSRMLAVRPAESGRMVTSIGNKGARQIWARAFLDSLNLPKLDVGAAHRFTAQLVEGALLIGPLPEATPVTRRATVARVQDEWPKGAA